MFGSSLRIVKSFLQAGANMASATLDSAAVFRERCTKFGLAPELLRKLIAAERAMTLLVRWPSLQVRTL